MKITGVTNPLLVICCVLTAAFFPIAIVLAWLRQKKQAMLAIAAKPWEQLEDWSCARANSRVQTKPTVLWGATVFTTLFFFAGISLPSTSKDREPDLWGFVMPMFVVAVFFLVCTVFAHIRWRRYGATRFQFDSLPFSPGGNLSGHVQVRHEAPLPNGLKVRLECLKIVGDDDPKLTTLWSSEQIITPNKVGCSPSGMRFIPVSFPLPNDALETNKIERNWRDLSSTSERISWRLLVNPKPGKQATLKGFFNLRYKDAFEVPVFRIHKNVLPMTPRAVSPARAARTETDSVLAGW